MSNARGITETNRRLLEVLHRRTAGPFSVVDAAGIWKLRLEKARRLVAHLAARGWLARVRRGTYVVVPLGATKPDDWREDPWVVAMDTFSPCYIGGWTACAHWELTEQIFRDVMVFSSRPRTRRRYEIQGTAFRVKIVDPMSLFGLVTVWRGRVEARASDPARTLVDVLDDPSAGGGIRHVSDVVADYFRSGVRDDAKLGEYASRLGHRTVFKRLGYLIEALNLDAPELVRTCRSRMSAGVSPLDPALPRKGRIVSRWRLLINATLSASRP